MAEASRNHEENPVPFFPPRPTLRGTKDYADDLRSRFRTSGAGQPPKAVIAVTVLEQVERAIAAVLPTLPSGEPARKLEDAETAVRAALNTYRQEENTARGNEAAAEYVQRALDLQVGKSGGLLAFNGMTAAVAAILWSTHPPYEQFLRVGLVGTILLSSIASLCAIYGIWPTRHTIATPHEDLAHSVALAAKRGWALNIGVLLAGMTALLLAAWMSKANA